MEATNGDSCKKRWNELRHHHFQGRCCSLSAVYIYLNYILHHGSKLKPQLVSLQICNFSCPVGRLEQSTPCLWPLLRAPWMSTSKIQQFSYLCCHVHDVFMHIPCFCENPFTPGVVPQNNSGSTQFHWYGTQPHPTCHVNNRAAWGRDAS